MNHLQFKRKAQKSETLKSTLLLFLNPQLHIAPWFKLICITYAVLHEKRIYGTGSVTRATTKRVTIQLTPLGNFPLDTKRYKFRIIKDLKTCALYSMQFPIWCWVPFSFVLMGPFLKLSNCGTLGEDEVNFHSPKQIQHKSSFSLRA